MQSTLCDLARLRSSLPSERNSARALSSIRDLHPQVAVARLKNRPRQSNFSADANYKSASRSRDCIMPSTKLARKERQVQSSPVRSSSVVLVANVELGDRKESRVARRAKLVKRARSPSWLAGWLAGAPSSLRTSYLSLYFCLATCNGRDDERDDDDDDDAATLTPPTTTATKNLRQRRACLVLEASAILHARLAARSLTAARGVVFVRRGTSAAREARSLDLSPKLARAGH